MAIRNLDVTSFLTARLAELGFGALPDFRRRGYGPLLVAAKCVLLRYDEVGALLELLKPATNR